jgi:hypothetical protein
VLFNHIRRAIALPHSPNSDHTPSTSQKAIAPLNSSNSDSYGALRYRTPSTPQKRTLQPPKQRFLRSASLLHPLNSPNSNRTPLNSPKSDRTPPTSKKRFLRSASLSHPLNSPNSDRTLQLPKSDRTLQLPKSDRTPQLPKSDRTPPTSQMIIQRL